MSDSSKNSNQELNTDETKSGDKISNVDSSIENAIEAYRKIREETCDIEKLTPSYLNQIELNSLNY